MVVDLSIKESLKGETVAWDGALADIFTVKTDPVSIENGLATQPGYEAFFGKLSAEAETVVKGMLLEIKKKEYDLEQITNEKYSAAKASDPKLTEKAATVKAEADEAVRALQQEIFGMMDKLLVYQRNELKTKKFTAALDTRRKSIEQLSNNQRKELGGLHDEPVQVNPDVMNSLRTQARKQ